RRILLEVGPRQSLSTFSRQSLGEKALGIFSCPGQGDGTTSELTRTMNTLGRLWICGASVDWTAMQAGARCRVALPTYPFERQRFWVDAEPTQESITTENNPATPEEGRIQSGRTEVDANLMARNGADPD